MPQADPPPTSTSTTQPTQPNLYTTSVLQICSSLSLRVTQTLPFPFDAPQSSTVPVGTAVPPVPNASLRLLTSSPAKSRLFLISTPTDRTAAAAEGSSIWQVTMKPWSEQLDELVRDGQYSDALALLDSLDEATLPDKVGPSFFNFVFFFPR